MKRFGKSFFATLAATHSRSVGLARSSTCSCPSRSLAPASHLAPSPIACRILMEFGAHDKRNHDGKLPRCGGASAASGMPRELDPKDESRIPAGSTLYSPDDPEPEWRTPKQEERGGDYVPDPASKPALVNCTGAHSPPAAISAPCPSAPRPTSTGRRRRRAEEDHQEGRQQLEKPSSAGRGGPSPVQGCARRCRWIGADGNSDRPARGQDGSRGLAGALRRAQPRAGAADGALFDGAALGGI